jgi:predicted NBD/HSP70 family sugar kinase
MTELFREAGGTAGTLRDVDRAAAAGDSAARDVLHRGAEALGVALGSFANVFDPDLVVIGGGVAGLGQWWLDRVRTAARATTIPAVGDLRIEVSTVGAAAVAVGAVSAARSLAAVPVEAEADGTITAANGTVTAAGGSTAAPSAPVPSLPVPSHPAPGVPAAGSPVASLPMPSLPVPVNPAGTGGIS